MYQAIYQQLAQQLSPHRFKHSIGVAQTAHKLAMMYDLNGEKARLAGILHDCAREIPKNHLLQLAREFGILVDNVELCQPILLHAPVGAKIAQTKYGIDDEEILQAIALHTTGGLNMTKLAMVIYVADFIEPGRDFPGIDKYRLLAQQDLKAALLATLDASIDYIIKKRLLIHPATIEARNELLLKNRGY